MERPDIDRMSLRGELARLSAIASGAEMVITPGASTSVVPLIVGVVSVVLAAAPPSIVTTGGAL